MNIISYFDKDNQTEKPKPGSYEWWYFDGMTTEGFSFVIIFYQGNPFSRRYIFALEDNQEALAEHFPAVSISVYKDGQPLFYSFEEVLKKDSEFSNEQPFGSIKENSFFGKRTNESLLFDLNISHFLPNGDAINGRLRFESPDINLSFSKNKGSSEHLWNLVQPACTVTGELKLSGTESIQINITGKGYHDHNVGTEPMKYSFDEWYWGRTHFEDATLVYYLMNSNGNQDYKAWLINNEGNIRPLEQTIELSDYSWSLFGLKSARKIDFKEDNISCLIQLDRLLDNGPFYRRFEHRAVLEERGRIKQARGISEYIAPARIYNKMFWPLVNMRIKYPGVPHWVQKNPTLYRWTW